MDDEQLLGLVAASLAHDRPSAEDMEAAYAAFGWRALEASLAQLIDDSVPEVIGFQQGPTYSRVVAFQTEHGSIDVAIGVGGFEVVLRPRPERMVLRRPDGGAPLPLPPPPPLPGAGGAATGTPGIARVTGSGITGPARIEATWSTGSAVTPWFTL